MSIEGQPYNEYPKNTQAECGIQGGFSRTGENIARNLAYRQDKLTNRGQDSSGATILHTITGEFVTHKGPGRARDVFENYDFEASGMEGPLGVAHNRYRVSIDPEKDEFGTQPIIVEYHGRSLATSYNGNLPDRLRARLQAKIPADMAPPPANIDTFDIARAIISSPEEEWEDKFKDAMGDIPLAYSLTMVTDDGRLFGLRCPRGTWPLWFAEKNNEIIFSSESRVERDPDIPWQMVKPGELVEATPDGIKRTQLLTPMQEQRCYLNDVYGARFDSLFNESSTYGEFRTALGLRLAQELPEIFKNADAVVGVPETALAIAQGLSEGLGIPMVELIGKNKPPSKKELNKEGLFVDTETGIIVPMLDDIEEDDNGSLKSFIQDGQVAMANMIDIKFDIPNSKLKAGDLIPRRIVLTDDTLIRANTMRGDPTIGARGIIKRLRASGVDWIGLVITARPFIEDCDQGYYIRKNQLIAVVIENGVKRILEAGEIAELIDADELHFMSEEGIKDVYEDLTGDRECVCMACMGGPHPLDQDPGYKDGWRPLTLYVNPESTHNHNGVSGLNGNNAHVDNPSAVGTINSE